MTGKEIRSFNHLAKECGASMRSAIINFNQGSYELCKVMVAKNYDKQNGGDLLFIFNNSFSYGGYKIDSVISSSVFEEYRDNLSRYYYKLISLREKDYCFSSELYQIIHGITLLPESFEEDYKQFMSENQKAIEPSIRKYGIDESCETTKIMYWLSGGSKNFFVWALNAYFHCRFSFNALKRILLWNENYKQLVKNLSKSTITAYTSTKDLCKLGDEIVELRKEKRINDSINMFNTAQKKVLRTIEISDSVKNIFSAFYRLSKSKKINFVRKMSTITDASEIMRQMGYVTSAHFNWSKESFMDYINNVEGISYEKVFDKDDVVLVKVKDFETVKRFAKTTNWCISKNKTYWNSYVENIDGAEQFILFDFSQKEDALTSIIGFTCKYNKGITNAHDFVNNPMLDESPTTQLSLMNSYISHLGKEGIYSLLESHGIDINLITKYEKPLYNWDKESMYKYLYECVDKENVHILTDNKQQVAISVTDDNIRYFLGDTYIDNTDSDIWGKEHIIFMSFNMSQFDPNRILYAVTSSKHNKEDYVLFFKNEHFIDCNTTFEAELSQFGLPYDTIRRVDDKYARLRDAITSYNVPEVMKGAEDKELFYNVLNDYVGIYEMGTYIKQSICQYASFDYLDIFYRNGYKMVDFLGGDVVIGIITDILNQYLASRDFTAPTQRKIDSFFNRKTTNLESTLHIANFLAIDRMLSHEIKDPAFNDVLYDTIMDTILHHFRAKGSAIDHFVELMFDNICSSPKNRCLRKIMAYALERGEQKLKEKIESKHGFSDIAPKARHILHAEQIAAMDELVRIDAGPQFVGAMARDNNFEPDME